MRKHSYYFQFLLVRDERVSLVAPVRDALQHRSNIDAQIQPVFLGDWLGAKQLVDHPVARHFDARIQLLFNLGRIESRFLRFGFNRRLPRPPGFLVINPDFSRRVGITEVLEVALRNVMKAHSPRR